MSSLMEDDDVAVPAPVVLETKSYQGITNDTRLIPTTDLLTHIEGAKWIVTYYSQILNADNEPTPYSPSIPPALQQYVKIREFELKVTTPLTPTNDTELAEFQAEGTALLFPHVLPNVGDVFTAEIAPGRLGVLVLKTAEPKSIFKESAYEITYQIRSYLDSDTAADLAAKVTKDVVYVRDFLRIGKNPMLVEAEYDDYETVLRAQQTAVQTYFSEFYADQFETFLVPDQSYTTYDPYATEFLLRLVNKDHHRVYRKVEHINCDDTHSEQTTTVWDALATADFTVIDYCSRKVVGVPSRYVFSHPIHRTIRYSGIAQVVRPDTQYPEVTTPLRYDLSPTVNPNRLSDLIAVTTLPGLTHSTASTDPIRTIPTLTAESYVFSEAFYTGVGALSELEAEVKKAMTTGDVSLAVVSKLFKQYKRWTPLERYYFIPVLVYLTYYAIGAIN